MKTYKRFLIISVLSLILVITLALSVFHNLRKSNLEKKIRFNDNCKDEISSILSGLDKYIYENDNLNSLIKDYSKETIAIDTDKLFHLLYSNKKYVDLKVDRWMKAGKFIDSNNQRLHLVLNKDTFRWKGRPRFAATMWSNGYNKINENGKGDDVVVFDSVVFTIRHPLVPVPKVKQLMTLIGKPLSRDQVTGLAQKYLMEVQRGKQNSLISEYYGFAFLYCTNKQDFTIFSELSLHINNVTYNGSMGKYKIYKEKLPLGLKHDDTAEEIIQRFHILNKDRYSTWMDFIDDKNNYKYNFYFPDGELINTISISLAKADNW